jgi:hypothetical protein
LSSQLQAEAKPQLAAIVHDSNCLWIDNDNPAAMLMNCYAAFPRILKGIADQIAENDPGGDLRQEDCARIGCEH